jgi:uncharacterized repeat protein (TIGR01451 family)
VTPPPGSAVGPGDRITYTLILTSNGTADVTGLVLTDTLPAGVSYIPGSANATPGLNIAAIPPPALVLTGALPVGDVLTVTFGVTVSTVSSGTLLTNWVEVTMTGADLVTSTATHPVIVVPNLLITKTATPTNGNLVEPGNWITYAVTVINSGDPASDVVLSDTLDLDNVTLVVSHTTDGVLSGPNPVRVTDLHLDSGQSVTLTLGVTVTGEVSGTLISNRASVTSTASPSPQFSGWVTHVISHTEVMPPSFVLTKSADPPSGASVTQGDAITYTIVAHNSGGPATNVVLSDAIPAGTTYVSDSAITNLGEVSFDGTQVRLDVPNFPANRALTTTFRVTVTTSITTINNVALLVSAQTGFEHSNSVSHPTQGMEQYHICLPVLLKDRSSNSPLSQFQVSDDVQ